jgi:hypothetical protein
MTNPSALQYIERAALVVLVITVAYLGSSKYSEHQRVADGVSVSEVSLPAPTSKTELDPSAHFVSVCSGMDITVKGVWLSAVSECIGRVRGFVDGHNLMSEVVTRVSGRNQAIQIFCVDSTVGSDQLITTVMDWADAHRDEYIDTIKQSDPRNAATIVMIKAFKSAYACANT